MNIRQAFPSNFITHEDLQGQDVPVQIAGCRMEPVKQDAGPDKDKPVIYFVGHQRGLVLNVTNAMTIAGLYGDETDAWAGKWITLFPTSCQFGSKMVDCIRIRPFPPQNAAPTAQGSTPQANGRPSQEPTSGPMTHTMMPAPHTPQFNPPPPPGQFDQQQPPAQQPGPSSVQF